METAFDAFDLQKIKSGAVFLYNDNFSLILADNIVTYLLFVIIYGNLLKYMYIAFTAQLFQ